LRPVRKRTITIGLFAAFAGVGLAADAVHGDGERRMRLAADRAEGHGAGDEALDDGGRAFDFFERDFRPKRLDVEEVANGEIAVFARVHAGREAVIAVLRGFRAFLEGADGVLEIGNDVGAPGVLFTA